MNDLGTFVTLLIGAITLATAAGLGWQRGKILRLKTERDEDRVRADRADTRADKLEEELHQCQSDLSALGRVVTGETHWVAIGELLEHHHGEAKENWVETRGLLLKGLEDLETVVEIVERYRR